MAIKQVSIFVENKPGTLVSITDAIGAAGVDIRAMSIADTHDFGILRLIVSDPRAAAMALSTEGKIVSFAKIRGRRRAIQGMAEQYDRLEELFEIIIQLSFRMK